MIKENSGSNGGGAYYSTLYNCIVRDNTASSGGGVFSSTFFSTAVIGNSAIFFGGGAYLSMLFNVTVTGNDAPKHGGVSQSVVVSSIVYFNNGDQDPNFDMAGSMFDASCTTPMPLNSTPTVITNEPGFMNAGIGDIRLLPGAPCIESGTTNNVLTSPTDLAGNLRVMDGNRDGLVLIDMGAYEFDPWLVIPEEWFLMYDLDLSDPYAAWLNPDNDPFLNWQEWVANTNPTDPLSAFHIEGMTAVPEDTSMTISFQSSTNRFYSLHGAMMMDGAWTKWTPVMPSTSIRGNGGMENLTVTNEASGGFYKVVVATEP